MKKAILVIATLLIGLAGKNVYANTLRSNVVSDTFDNWTGFKAYNWTSSSNYSEMTLDEFNYGYMKKLEDTDTGMDLIQMIDVNELDISNVGSNGVTLSISSSKTYLPHVYYTIVLYYCTMNNVAVTIDDITIGSGWMNTSNHATISSIGNTALHTGIFMDYTQTGYQYCKSARGYFYSNYTGNVIGIKIKSSSTTGWYVFTGLQTEAIVPTDYLTESQLNSAISNSGLATASSVSAVQSSVNQVQQELNGVNDSINETNDILTEDHNYNNNASETIEGKDDIDDMSEAEEDLMGELDFSGAQELEITINPNASQYIWQIVERLRTLPGVTILMTSILGLGIIKMILNR